MKAAGMIIIMGILCYWVACTNGKPAYLTINMEHVVEGEKLLLEDKMYHTSSGHGYQVFRLKYYLSDFVLEKSDGSTFKIVP